MENLTLTHFCSDIEEWAAVVARLAEALPKGVTLESIPRCPLLRELYSEAREAWGNGYPAALKAMVSGRVQSVVEVRPTEGTLEVGEVADLRETLPHAGE